MDAQNTPLDSKELMHIALYEAEQSNPSSAIKHLKQLLDLEPNNGNARYLLGALHAEIGMYEEAINEMQRAIDSDPDLPTTSVFQLGLLHLTSGNIDEAKETWSALDKLGSNDALFLFKDGMLDLIDESYNSCINKLREGIALNTLNTDLNRDMLNVINRAEAAAEKAALEHTDTETNSTAKDSQRARLSIYESEQNV